MYSQINKVLVLLVLLVGFSCSATQSLNSSYRPTLLHNNAFLLTEVSNDKSYGYSQKNPIKVGGVDKSQGPLNEHRFLNALSGPNGEPVHYERLGSCCGFNTPNGPMGSGMLDRYEVSWEGQQQPVILYLNMYDYDELKAPLGFTFLQ